MTRTACIAIAGILTGTLLIAITVVFTKPTTPTDADLWRAGFVLLIVGATFYVRSAVRRLTAHDIERARQRGYDEGRADAFAVQPELIDLDSARAALAERRAAQQL